MLIFGILVAMTLLVGWRVKDLSYSRPLPDIQRWSFSDKLYMTLKIFRPVLKAEKNKGIEAHFARQHLDFTLPDGFIPQTSLTLSAGGDIMHSHGYSPQSLAHIWDDLGADLFAGDLVFANLETPIDPTRAVSIVPSGRRMRDWIYPEAPRLNGTELCLEVFGQGEGHLDVVSTASNHCLNMGSQGLERTLDVLDERGIIHVGTSRSATEQEDIPIVERNGIKVAFLGYTFSLNQDRLPEGGDYLVNFLLLNEPQADIEMIRRHIRRARGKGAEVIVASLHWGQDIEAYPTQDIIDRGHAIIEAGVDVIIGHHPHMLQPMERYTYIDPVSGQEKAGLIAYSLSELMSYLHFLPVSWVSCFIKIELVKGRQAGREVVRISRVRMVPFFKLCREGDGGGYAFRQIDLRKTLNQLLYYKEVYRLSTREMIYLIKAHAFLERYILPRDASGILEPLGDQPAQERHRGEV